MLTMAVWVPLALVVLLLPGMAVAALSVRRCGLGWQPYPLVLVGSSLVHLVAFFLWFWAPWAGRSWTWMVLVSSVTTLLMPQRRRTVRQWTRDRDLCTVLVLMIGAALAVLGSLLLHGGALNPTDVATQRWTDTRMPPDNVLPAMLADRVVRHAPTEPFFGGWRSSDRPPLQAAAVAFTEPVRVGLTFEQHYQVVSTVLAVQCLGALWMLLRRLGVTAGITGAAVLAASASGTVLLNSAYVWPKLLSAALVLCAAALLVPEGRPGWSVTAVRRRLNWVWAGVGAALALLAHGAALFALLPGMLAMMAWALIARLRRPQLPSQSRRLSGAASRSASGPVAGMLAGTLTMVPWLIYQRTVAPPGDRLLTWHLGGVTDPVAEPWYRVMVQHYRAVGWSGAWHNHVQNVAVLANPARWWGDALGWSGSPLLLRSLERGHVLNGVGVGWLGLACIPIVLAVPRFRWRLEGTVGAVLLGAAAWMLLMWCALMFGPAGTIPDTSTAVVALLLLAGPVLVAAAISPWAAWAVAALACVRFGRVWLFSGDPLRPLVSIASVCVLIIGALMVVLAAASATWTTTSARISNPPVARLRTASPRETGGGLGRTATAGSDGRRPKT